MDDSKILDLTSDEREHPWYFYADTRIDYFCRFDPAGQIPPKFHGEYESRAAAMQAWLEWSLEQMEGKE